MTTSSGFISTGRALYDENNPGLSLLLVQVLIILLMCYALSVPLKYLQQPKVIAEVVGGILLGPTALGRWAWFRQTFFDSKSLGPLNLLANIGLILFMLLMGLELDLGVVKSRAQKSLVTAFAGMIVPFALSIGVSKFMYESLPGANFTSFSNFLLFIGVAMSVTALPVLARILTEKKLLQTPLGVIVISAAAVDDAVSWAMLALVVSLISASTPLSALYIFLTAIAFAMFMLVVMRPILLYLHQKLTINENAAQGTVPSISHPMVVIAFIVTMISSFFTNAIGIHSIFGGFLTGLSLPRERGFAVALTHRLEDFVTIVLLPLYFTYSGLRTNIGSLSDGLSWGCFFLVLAAAVFGKLGGCTLAARATGSTWREAVTIEVITEQIFAIMVLMAIVTTAMTSPLISHLYPPSCYSNVEIPDDSQAMLEKTDIEHTLEKPLNLVLAIPELNSVSCLIHLLRYIHGPEDAVNDEKKGNTTIHAAKYLALNDRMSTVLLATNEMETIQRDPALSIFNTFGKLKRMTIVPHLVLTKIEDYGKDVSQLAYENHSDFVIMPWQSKAAKTTSKNSADKRLLSIFNHHNEHSPQNSSAIPEESIHDRLSDITDQLIRKCRIKVGILVDRETSTKSQQSECDRILVVFYGGPDDREAVLFALRLATRKQLEIHVLHLNVVDERLEQQNASSIDEEDKKMIDYVQSLEKIGFSSTIKYTYKVTENPLKMVKEELEAYQYELVVCGHFGPRWNLLFEQKQEEQENLELNANTVWSMLQATVHSISSTKGELSVAKNDKIDRILGPLGSYIYKESKDGSSLLVIRKIRRDKWMSES